MIKIIKGRNIKWWVSVMTVVILFGVIFSFTFIKTRNVFRGVQIVATFNKEADSQIADIKGKAPNAIYLTLNGREIFIDKDGSFNEPTALPSGVSVITLSARDKFGKTAEKKFEVVYKDNKEVALINK